MTSKERFMRIYQHQEADRIPIIDSPWDGTIARWKKEGMPENTNWTSFFDVDKTATISVDVSPQYQEKVLEKTKEYSIVTTPWGVTLKRFNEMDSTPEFLDFSINTPEMWQQAKQRMFSGENRIPWDYLKENYDRWVQDGYFLSAGFWFGFDVTHSWMVGTETLLIALLEEPDWVMDMFDAYLNNCTRLFDKVWEAGYHFDQITWPDDMGYKGTSFFSAETYRTLVKPFHKRACEWAHSKGIYAHMHSCGNINALLPDILDAGVDAINPLEVKAGMDPLELKRLYGDRVVLHGGINAVLWNQPEAIMAEMERLIPTLKENGGYVFSSDHSIPNNVSLQDFRAIVAKAKELGQYT